MPRKTTNGRWQDDGLAISFRACRLVALDALGDALAQSASGVTEDAVSHLDLAENELPSLDGLAPYARLLSLDASHNLLEAGGLRALYQGVLPNMLKVLPATSISYAVYDRLAG